MCQHGTTKTLLLPTPDYEDPGGLRYKLRLWPVDSCIADIVQALASAGVVTTGSCCGHSEGCGTILLADGRALVVTTRNAALETGLPHAQPMTWEEHRTVAERAELEHLFEADPETRAMFDRVRAGLGLISDSESQGSEP
jgi:hypothetical protein